jgi:hypothetical protein
MLPVANSLFCAQAPPASNSSDAERRHAVELREGEVRQDDVERALAQCCAELLFGLHPGADTVDAFLAQPAHRELRVGLDILYK